jgi:hypothetical protein
VTAGNVRLRVSPLKNGISLLARYFSRADSLVPLKSGAVRRVSGGVILPLITSCDNHRGKTLRK